MRKSAAFFLAFLGGFAGLTAYALGDGKLTDVRQSKQVQTAADSDASIIWTSETAGIDGTQLGLNPATGAVVFRWRK